MRNSGRQLSDADPPLIDADRAFTGADRAFVITDLAFTDADWALRDAEWPFIDADWAFSDDERALSDAKRAFRNAKTPLVDDETRFVEALSARIADPSPFVVHSGPSVAARAGLLVALLAPAGCCLEVVPVSQISTSGEVIATGSSSSSSGGVSLSGSSSSTTGSSSFGFLPAVTYSVGQGPFSIAVADYNLDHQLDLAVANNGNGSVSLLLGNGDGTFQLPTLVTIGGAPFWIAASDLSGDGAPDLAIANSGLDVVQILFNNAGSFGAPPVAYPTGNGPNCVVAADFNGDGLPDLAVSNYGDTTVSVFWGLDAGTFIAGPTLSGFESPIFVAALPGGSLVVTDQHSDEVDVYSMAENWMFSGSAFSGAGSWPTSVAIGDLNHDGLPDLAASDWSGGVCVLMGIAGGGFNSTMNYAAGMNPNSVVMADFNLDGNLDLAVANADSFSQSPGVISVFLGLGDGTFAPQATFAVGASPVDIAVGDFNGDGYPDLAVANNGDNTISILLTTH